MWTAVSTLAGMTSSSGSPAPAGPVPAPPPRSHRLRNILIAVGVVAVLCCAGAVTGGVFLFRGVLSANAPVRAATETFVTDLQAGDYAGAYRLLCADTQAAFPQNTFIQAAQSQPHIATHRTIGSNVSNVNGRLSAQVTMDLTMNSGFVERHVFLLVREGADWKVCGQPY
jgi:hypothetical protein